MREVLYKTAHTTIVKEENGHEMIKRPVAVAILAYHKDKDEIIMVRQERGSFGKILEVPAGKVDKGEDPMDAVRRELLEETGYKAGVIKHTLDYYPSVGYSTEIISCYTTEDIVDTGKQRLDDGERVEVVRMNGEELYEKIRSGEIKDSKTLMCVSAGILRA